MAKANLLLVDDDAAVARMVSDYLKKEGYRLRWAKTAFQAEGLVERELPDLVILDRTLPDKDGLELCRAWRQAPRTQALPILFLSGKSNLPEKVSGLRMGADDYLPKPFKLVELLARVEAVLRRSGLKALPVSQIELGELRLDLSARKAFRKGEEIELSPKEYDLLQAFMEQPGRVLGRPALLESVWGYDEAAELTTKVVDVTVGHLRRKLGPSGEKIAAVTGYGYRFDP